MFTRYPLCMSRVFQFKVSDDTSDLGLVSHFPAHFAPVTSLTFDPSGTLLLTTDKHGEFISLFNLSEYLCIHLGIMDYLCSNSINTYQFLITIICECNQLNM